MLAASWPCLVGAGGAGLRGARSTARGQAPGPEIFAKPPKTPLELWDAADYLVRTGQVRQAVPYLDKFLKSQPDDDDAARRSATGTASGSILRLDDDPATRALARPLVAMLGRGRRSGTRPGPSGSSGSSPR